MKCPKCGGGVTVSYPRDFGFVHRCNCCGKEWNNRKAIDPTELKDLIERAIWALYRREDRLGARAEIVTFEIIKSYLRGDPKPLKKLAGEP